jgi:hypothetical protein
MTKSLQQYLIALAWLIPCAFLIGLPWWWASHVIANPWVMAVVSFGFCLFAMLAAIVCQVVTVKGPFQGPPQGLEDGAFVARRIVLSGPEPHPYIDLQGEKPHRPASSPRSARPHPFNGEANYIDTAQGVA